MTPFARCRVAVHVLLLDLYRLRELPDGGDEVAMRLVRGTLSPGHAAALWALAHHAAGGGRADLSPVIARLARAEVERLWPGAWSKIMDHVTRAPGEPKDQAMAAYEALTRGDP